jgi:hypothetical protein
MIQRFYRWVPDLALRSLRSYRDICDGMRYSAEAMQVRIGVTVKPFVEALLVAIESAVEMLG